jgi:parvulin-like peptidyl-prolyl isomerase
VTRSEGRGGFARRRRGASNPVLASRAVARTLARLVGISAAVVSLALGVAACGDGATSDKGGADLPAGVVAQLADQQVTEDELNRAVEQQIAQAQQAQTPGQEAPPAPKPGTPEYDAIRRNALENIRIQRLVEVEARKCGKPCEVTEKDVDKELKKVRDQNFEGSQKKLEDFLKASKLTMDDARRILRLSLLQPKLFNRVTRGVRFTEADARKYYDANIAQFKVPAGRTARHILVKTKAEADAIRARLTTENFAEIARKESLDPGSGKQGGDLGPIQKGQLVPEFEKVAFALRDGEISDPVKTQFGWHIIQVEITPARTTPFEEARAQIVQSQLQQKRNEAFTTFRDKILADWKKRSKYADPKLDPNASAATTPATTAPPATTSTP